MTEQPTPLFSRPWVRMGLLAAGAALATVLVMSLYANISTRKAEGRQTSLKVVDLDEKTVDPAIWGKNFPSQFDAYKRTAEKYSTKYGGAGSEGLPKSRIQEDPRLVTIFDGYAFAIDFNQRQGHAYMLDDQRTTKRVTTKPQVTSGATSPGQQCWIGNFAKSTSLPSQTIS